MQYKYINKENKEKGVLGTLIPPFGAYTSNGPVPELDYQSDGFNFDRYIDGVLTNTSNDNIDTELSIAHSDIYFYVDQSTTVKNGSGLSRYSPFKDVTTALNAALKIQTTGSAAINIYVAEGTYHLQELPFFGSGIGQKIVVIGVGNQAILPNLELANVNIRLENVRCTLKINNSHLQIVDSTLASPTLLTNYYGDQRVSGISGEYVFPDSLLSYSGGAPYGYHLTQAVAADTDLVVVGFTNEEDSGYPVLLGYDLNGIPTNTPGYDRVDITRSPNQYPDIAKLFTIDGDTILLITVLTDPTLNPTIDEGWRIIRIEDVTPTLPSKELIGEVEVPLIVTGSGGNIDNLNIVSYVPTEDGFILKLLCDYDGGKRDTVFELTYTSSTETLSYNELDIFATLYDTGGVFELNPSVRYRVIDSKIYAAYLDQGTTEIIIVRINLDGSIDSTFGVSGVVTVLLGQDIYTSIYTVDTYKTITGITTVGLIANNDVHFVALTDTGTVDEQYGLLGRQTVSAQVTTYAGSGILSDGRIFFVGFVEDGLSYGVGVWCMTPEGLYDWYYTYSFPSLVGVDTPTQFANLKILCVDSDNNIYISTDIGPVDTVRVYPFILVISPNGALVSNNFVLDEPTLAPDRLGSVVLSDLVESITESNNTGTVYTLTENTPYIVRRIDSFGQVQDTNLSDIELNGPVILPALDPTNAYIIDTKIDGISIVKVDTSTGIVDTNFSFNTNMLGWTEEGDA